MIELGDLSLWDCTCDECAGVGRFADGAAGDRIVSDEEQETADPRERAGR